MCVYVLCVWVCMPECACGQKKPCGSQFSVCKCQLSVSLDHIVLGNFILNVII